MRTYYDIDLTSRNITKRELHGEEIVRAGRYWIAKTLLEFGAATVDPLSPANPLIFSAGPFAGTSFSNANPRTAAARVPLGGIKEANGGAASAMGSGQQKSRASPCGAASWVVIHFRKDGAIDFDDPRPYLGKGNFRPRRCGTRSTAAMSRSRSAGPSANTKVCSAASRSATRTAGPRGCRRAAAWAR